MRFQRLDGVEVPRQLRFAKSRMDFVMANLVQAHRLAAFAAAELRNEVVQALFGLRRDRSVAEWADRIGRHKGMVV